MSHKHYPIRIPKFAAGIRAQDLRSGSGRSWWSRRFLSSIEAMRLGPRFSRGRNYAISGQVVSLEICGPKVTAIVVGSRPDPYTVTLDFRTPNEVTRGKIIERIKSEPMLVGRLLADDMPLEIDEIFRSEGLDLFPGGKIADRTYDVTTKCSCPDWANPCKHSAAVLLLLGEECARHPMTLLELRGISMEDLCNED